MSFIHVHPLIRVLTPADASLFPEALKLLNRTQGEDLFGPDYLEVMSKKTDVRIFAAFFEERLIGIGIAQLISDLSYYSIFDAHIVTELSRKKVGSFSTLAIQEEFQGKGIGQKISQQRLAWLKSEHCDVVLGTSWVSGLAHTSHRVF